jgi:hypothetical protein
LALVALAGTSLFLLVRLYNRAAQQAERDSQPAFEIAVDLSATRGTNVALFVNGEGTPVGVFPLTTSGRTTYTFRAGVSVVDRIRLDPTDEAGAEIRIYRIVVRSGTDVLRDWTPAQQPNLFLWIGGVEPGAATSEYLAFTSSTNDPLLAAPMLLRAPPRVRPALDRIVDALSDGPVLWIVVLLVGAAGAGAGALWVATRTLPLFKALSVASACTALAIGALLPALATYGTTVDIDLQTVGPDNLQVYVNRATQPALAAVTSGRRATYSVQIGSGAVTEIRLDPADTAGRTVRLFGMTVRHGGRRVANLLPSDLQRCWVGGATPGRIEGNALVTRSTSTDSMVTCAMAVPGGEIPDAPFRGAAIWIDANRPGLRFMGQLLLAIALVAWIVPVRRHALVVPGSVAVGILSAAVGAVAFWSYPEAWREAGGQFSPEFLSEAGNFTVPQLLAHRAGLLALLVLAAVSTWCSLAPPRRRALPALVGAALAVGVLASVGYHQVLQQYADLLLGDVSLLAGLIFCVGAVMGLEHRVAALVLAAFALSAALLPGVLTTHNLTFSSPGTVAFIETHYSLMPGAGARLGAGFAPGTDVKLWYGLLFPVIGAGLERLAGPMSMAFYLTSIQWLQVGFAALAVVAYRSWRPREYWYLLISLMLLLPWLSTSSVGIYYPNHSAWRHLNFALAACAVIVSRHAVPERRWVVLGAVVALSSLVNPVGGLATTIATVVMLAAREPLRLDWLRRALAYVLGAFIAVLAVFAVAGYFWAGTWVATPASLRQTPVGGGLIGGTPVGSNAPLWAALWMFVHASAVLAAAAMVRARRVVGPDGGVRVFIACLLVLWLAYFANRPANGWYLWTAMFLYTFLVPDLVAPLRKRGLRPGRTVLVLRPVAAVLMCAFLTPVAREGVREAVEGTKQRLGPVSDGALWSGVWIRADAQQLLTEKLDGIRAHGNRVAYFGANTFTLPQASGLYVRVPVQDPYGETMLRSDYDRLLRALTELRPDVLLFEPEGSPFYYSPYHAAFFKRFTKDATAGYARVSSTRAWDVWQRVESKPEQQSRR